MAIDTNVFTVSTRVRVRRDREHGPGPWPDEPSGTIITAPDDNAPYTFVATTNGIRLQYWIRFDEPQRDADGDGPYELAQVLSTYIEPLFEPTLASVLPDDASCVAVFCLTHTYEQDDEERFFFLGVFSSYEKATKAAERLRTQPGFVEHPWGFNIDQVRLDQLSWEEGFITD